MLLLLILNNVINLQIRVTGQGKVGEIQGQGNLEFCEKSGNLGNWSGKFDFLMSYVQ